MACIEADEQHDTAKDDWPIDGKRGEDAGR